MPADRDYVEHSIQKEGSVLLHGEGWGEAGGLLFTGPRQVLRPRSLEQLLASVEVIDEAVNSGLHVAGYLSYEAGALLMGLGAEVANGPLAWFAMYADPPVELTDDRAASEAAAAVTGIDFHPHRDAYGRAFGAVKRHIREGDVYQINLTGRGHFRFAGGAAELYRHLRRRQPSAYGALINTGEKLVMSFSPELFFERTGASIRTRPMKGTAPREADPERDAQLRRMLASDPKNRAENLMIVDLLRNDLSVVCEPGSVEAKRMFEVEPLPTVWQMTSEVEGTLRKDASYGAIFRALFPCGSVTGAPKRRAMQLIRKLEPSPRGVYCGAIGYIAPESKAVFNVAIRTIGVEGSRGTIGAGGGIVWDSDEASEFEEMHLKTRFLSRPDGAVLGEDFHLIETMRMTGGAVPLLGRHLKRLERSARSFGIPFDEADLQRRLAGISGDDPDATVRVALCRDGSMAVEARDVLNWPERVRIGIAPERVRSRDALLYHKTSRRGLFDEALKWARSQGLDEAVLLNERGEITQGTRSSIFIMKDGRWLTPPVTAGLLPGVYRDWMLETEDALEAVLMPEDVASADRILIVNGVRGAGDAVLVPT